MTGGVEELPLVGVIMGSSSDKDVMGEAIRVLLECGVPFEYKVLSAHRTPELVEQYASTAEKRGLRIIIAGAGGGAAHLAGVAAARTHLPVHGVAIQSDSVPSILGMPGGVPVACFGVGKSGAKNAALQAVRVLALTDAELHAWYLTHMALQAADVVGRQQPELDAFVANLMKGDAA
ncbi:MAG: 5-(carboxyamino)imidazole ribonucleotide mutase [bacterium]|nr:5-(carboxyamino)imidazole ribonucleotide mutase [bacterium]